MVKGLVKRRKMLKDDGLLDIAETTLLPRMKKSGIVAYLKRLKKSASLFGRDVESDKKMSETEIVDQWKGLATFMGGGVIVNKEENNTDS